MKMLLISFILFSKAFSSSYPAGQGTTPESDSDWIGYDDGTYNWISYDGTYRGVWFNLHDFLPYASGSWIDQAQLWLYHHPSYPWDVSDVYVELWNGNSMGPIIQLDQTMTTAIHAAPIYVYYDPSVYAGQHFWCLANTEMSTGGWPSILVDNAQGTIFHSFYSDDFIVWEPWTFNDLACNYFVRIYSELSFNNTTWGELKTAF